MQCVLKTNDAHRDEKENNIMIQWMKEVSTTTVMHANEVLFSAKEMYLIGLIFARNNQK